MKRLLELSLESNDEAAQLALNGQINLNGTAPRYDARLNVERADFHEIGLSADSVSLFAGALRGRVTGRTLEEMSCDIDLTDLSYVTSLDTVTTDLITIDGRSMAGDAHLSLESDFVDVTS